jgi:hypothetical protein
MSDGYEIGGREMTESALYPWSVGSIARALLFYAQQGSNDNCRALSAIASYYSLFHLSMFLVFSCPELQRGQTKSKIQEGVRNGSDPSPKIRHIDILHSLQSGIQHGLPGLVIDTFQKAQDLRNFINYGPRVNWSGSGSIHVNTCKHNANELATLRSQIAEVFHEAVEWACESGADDGVWIPQALSAVRLFFSGEKPFYADWCTSAEAATAELLRATLAKVAERKVFGDIDLEKKSIKESKHG